jgi:filamentous hemagglutinin
MQHHFHNRNGSKNDAASTTKSAISQGTITATKEHLDVNVINRNTQDSLNKLGKIFDKKKVEERQELAQLFAKNADGLLHYYDRDGKFDKVAAHGIVAEITSQIAGNKAGNGFISGAANEALINKIKVWSHGDPAKAQWISAALGATVNGVIGKSSHTGSAVAQYGTKWNESLRETLEAKISEYKDSAAKEAMNEAQYLVNNGYINPSEMVQDYYSLQLSWGEGIKTASTGCIKCICISGLCTRSIRWSTYYNRIWSPA